jgi:hypothetical protein
MLSLCFVLTVTFTMIDYLIIGSGLAGIGFSEIALQHSRFWCLMIILKVLLGLQEDYIIR